MAVLRTWVFRSVKDEDLQVSGYSVLRVACHHLRETTQSAPSSLEVNHAARSIRFAPVLVLPSRLFLALMGLVLQRWRHSNIRKMETQQLTSTELSQFTGTENWYRHPIVRKMLYTDGIRHLMNKAGAHWLIDEIVFQQYHPRVKTEEFQVWVFGVNLNQSTGVLHCEDGNGRVLCSKQIPCTDFPLVEIKIYVSDNVILLPSEY